jgi:hypothetical protein
MKSNKLPRPTENDEVVKCNNVQYFYLLFFFSQMVSPSVSPSTLKHLVIQTTPFKPPSGAIPVNMQKSANNI